MIEGNSWGYWAHLAVYHFAVQFCRGGAAIDVGSGSGYGAAYLAQHGAKVTAFDASSIAIEHSRARYADSGVTFEIADLNLPIGLPDQSFDLVFSSNVFEHVANVDLLAAECARIMKADGVAVIAVPPICNPATMASDMDNHFHLHHIPPTAWQAKLERFFETVECHVHRPGGRFPDREDHIAQLSMPPESVTIRQTDFSFEPIDPARFADGITAVYVCRGHRTVHGPETIAERTPAEWNEGAAVARKLADMQAQIAALKQQLAMTQRPANPAE